MGRPGSILVKNTRGLGSEVWVGVCEPKKDRSVWKDREEEGFPVSCVSGANLKSNGTPLCCHQPPIPHAGQHAANTRGTEAGDVRRSQDRVRRQQRQSKPEHREPDSVCISLFALPGPTPAPATIGKGPDPEGNISALFVIVLSLLRWGEREKKFNDNNDDNSIKAIAFILGLLCVRHHSKAFNG